MSYTKKKFALWLTPETKELVERCYQLDNSQSQSEFIERAIQFYTGYLEAEQDGTYLPVTLSAVLEGSLGALGDRLGKLLFKMSVEMSMMMHLMAHDTDAMLSAFAQAESESISESVKWGIRQAMREGKVRIQYKRLYGFKRGEDGGLEIVPEQAVVVRSIYDQYLAGASYSMIKERLEAEHILNASGKQEWSLSVIRSILTNEKYYGDVLQQKTFTQDCISKKKVRNTGQLPMYLVTNNHQGIIDRQTFDAVQVEMARRGACKSPSRKNAPTGLSAYKSRYALSERLVCGECGTLYRRCTWSKRGKKKVVWRCVSRLDYGTKYCHKSPTLEEGSLQRTILAAISSVMSQKETIISRITGAMEQTLAPIPGETMSLSEIEQRLAEIDEEVRRVVAQTAEQGLSICADHMKALTDECAELKKQRSRIQEQRTNNSALMKRVDDVASTLRQTSPTITEWDESLIRQLVDTVKVVSAEKIIVYLQGGTQVEQNMVE